MNIDKNYNIKINNQVETKQPETSDIKAKTEDEKYDSLVQDTRSYTLPFMGKKHLLTPQELEVKRACDKLFNEKTQTTVERRKANWDFFTHSTDENMAKLTELEEKENDFFKDEKLYEKFQNISKNYKIKNPDLKETLNCILDKFKTAINPENDETEHDNELDNLENEVKLKANSFEPTKECNDYGDYIAKDLIKLVKARNAEAKKNGFENYYEMALNDYGMNSKELEPMFDKIIKSTENAFINYKDVPEATE